VTHHFVHHWCSRSRDGGSHRCFETVVIVDVQSSRSIISKGKQGWKMRLTQMEVEEGEVEPVAFPQV